MAYLVHPDRKARAVVRDHRDLKETPVLKDLAVVRDHKESRETLAQGVEMVRMVRTGEMALLVQPDHRDHRDLREKQVNKALGVQQVHRGLKGTLVHKARKAKPDSQGATTRLPLKL